MIDGIALQYPIAHTDERGFFLEIVRASDPLLAEGFAQLSHSFMHAGVAKAWHVHARQCDWWYLVTGRLKVALFDLRFGKLKQEDISIHFLPLAEKWKPSLSHIETSATLGILQEFILGDQPTLLRIPPGVAHGCKALTDSHLVYITSNEYDGTDEGRIAHDDPAIGYDWEKGAEIK